VNRAFVLGGTGLVGRAIALRLARIGWRVDVTGRDAANMPSELSALGVSFVRADSRDASGIAAACGVGADLLVDCVCYSAADAQRLLPLARSATSTVMISSKAVYVDDHGNHSNSDWPPRFNTPVRESQRTLPAREDIPYDSREGYGVNKVAAEHVLLDSGQPVSVLRPSKIHGRGARPPREWMWVKRALDGRRHVFLAHRGEGGDHTTAAANIAALVETCARVPGARVLNSADPDAPNGLDIVRTIARRLDLEWEEVLLDGPPLGNVGRHAWDRYPPVVLDTSAAVELGYRPVGDYAATVADEVDWPVDAAGGGAEAARLPAENDPFFASLLDYAAEDRLLARE
jgi:nucleoside-diphosphate-sugar epimerase